MPRPTSYTTGRNTCSYCKYRMTRYSTLYCGLNADTMPMVPSFRGTEEENSRLYVEYLEAFSVWEDAHIVDEDGLCDEYVDGY